jgi:hypothetical protein
MINRPAEVRGAAQFGTEGCLGEQGYCHCRLARTPAPMMV